MPTFIELMRTETKIKIGNLSMFIMKYFEIRNNPTLSCFSFLFVYTCS